MDGEESDGSSSVGGWVGEWQGPHGAALVSGIAVLVMTGLFWSTSNRVIAQAAALAAYVSPASGQGE